MTHLVMFTELNPDIRQQQRTHSGRCHQSWDQLHQSDLIIGPDVSLSGTQNKKGTNNKQEKKKRY